MTALLLTVGVSLCFVGRILEPVLDRSHSYPLWENKWNVDEVFAAFKYPNLKNSNTACLIHI